MKNNFINNYKIITGKSILFPITIGLIWLVALLIVFRVSVSGINSSVDALSLERSFWTTKTALFASGIGVGFLFIPVTFGSRLLTLRKMDCYLLTVKDRFNTYKSFYLFSYIVYCSFAVLFIALVYLLHFLMIGKLSSQTLLLFIADEENILFAFALLPYVIPGKKISGLFFKGVILMIIYNAWNIIIMRENSLYLVIGLGVGIPGLMFLSNHRWLKIMKAAFDSEEEQK